MSDEDVAGPLVSAETETKTLKGPRPSLSLLSNMSYEEEGLAGNMMLFNSGRILPATSVETEEGISLCTAAFSSDSKLSEEHIKTLSQCLTILTLAQNESITVQGEKATFWFVVLAGSVKREQDGRWVGTKEAGSFIDTHCYYDQSATRSFAYSCNSQQCTIGIMHIDEIPLLDYSLDGLASSVGFMLAQQSINTARLDPSALAPVASTKSDPNPPDDEGKEEDSYDNDFGDSKDVVSPSSSSPTIKKRSLAASLPMETLYTRKLKEIGKSARDIRLDTKKRVDLAAQIKKTKANNAGLSKKMATMKHKVDQYDSTKKMLEHTRQQLTAKKLELESSQNQHKKLQLKVSESKKEVDVLRKRVKSDAKAAEHHTKKEVEAAKNELRAQISKLNNDLKEKDEELADLNDMLTTVQGQHSALSADHTERGAEHQEMTQALHREKQRTVKLEISVQQLTTENQHLRLELAQHHEHNKQMEAKHDLLQRSVDSSEADLRNSMQQLRDYKMRATSSEVLRQNESALLTDRVKKITQQFRQTIMVKEDYLNVIRMLAARMFVRAYRMRKATYSILKHVAEINWVALDVEQDVKCPSVQESDLQKIQQRTQYLLNSTRPSGTKLMSTLESNVVLMKDPLLRLLKTLKASANFFFTKNVQVTSDLHTAREALKTAEKTMNETLGLLSEKTSECERTQEELEQAQKDVAKLERMKEHWQRMEQKQKLEEARDAIFARSYSTLKKHQNRVLSSSEKRNAKKKTTSSEAEKDRTPIKKSKSKDELTHVERNPLFLAQDRTQLQSTPKKKERKATDKAWDWDRSREHLARVTSPAGKTPSKSHRSTEKAGKGRKHVELKYSTSNPGNEEELEDWLNSKYKQKIALGNGWEPRR